MSNNKLTVIQVLPALNGGGVEKGTLEIGRYLTQHGHQSIVISSGGRMVPQLIEEGSKHIQADIGAKHLATLRYIPWFRNILLDIRPDVVHLRSRLPAWICYLAWKSLPGKLRPGWVTTFHGQHSVNRYSAIMASGERVITVSQFMRDYIIRSYPQVDPKKIAVIPRGVDTSLYQPAYRIPETWLSSWYAQYPQTQGIALLTLPGRLSRRKGLEDFILTMGDLIKDGRAVHGLIVGEAHPKQARYVQELQQRIAAKGLTRHITLTGHSNDLINIMALSNAVLSLSKEPESFGRTVLEALSLGVPVIGYDHGGVGEQLSALFPSGKIATGDLQALTETCKAVLTNSMPPVKTNTAFTLDSMCSRTLAVYQNLIAGKNLYTQ